MDVDASALLSINPECSQRINFIEVFGLLILGIKKEKKRLTGRKNIVKFY